MAEQFIAPVIPNLGPQAEAMAGAQAVTFTATDRQIIKERAGEIDRTKSFKELFFKRDLTQKVENEQSTVNPEQDLAALETRRREHRKMLKYSALSVPHERVELQGEIEEAVLPPVLEAEAKPTAEFVKVEPATSPPVQQSPSTDYEKLTDEQNKLHGLISKIKELHFKLVLCDNEQDYKKYSTEIRSETLAGGQAEARDYLNEKVDELLYATASYKLNLLKSIQTIHIDDESRKSTVWLERLAEKYFSLDK